MSLPFFCVEIFVNSDAICWWWPHFLGSLSKRQIKSGHTFFTKYIKLSWHNFICSINFFSTANLSWSVVNKSFSIGSPFNISHKIYFFYTPMRLILKPASLDTIWRCTWQPHLVVYLYVHTRFGTSMDRQGTRLKELSWW